jgi:hypothetical protein
MSQISSLPQPTQSVSRVLTADNLHTKRASDLCHLAADIAQPKDAEGVLVGNSDLANLERIG